MSSSQDNLNTAMKSPLASRNSPYFEYSRSSTKRMYEAVFKIIDFDDSQISIQPSTTQPQETNGSRLNSLLTDETMLEKLYQKMKSQRILDYYPILKVCCQKRTNSSQDQSVVFDYNSLYQLDYSDLAATFSRFNDLSKIIVTQDLRFAYVFFNTFHAAYMAQKILNGFVLKEKSAKLYVNWTQPQEYDYFMPQLGVYLNHVNWHLIYKYTSYRTEDASSLTNQQKQNKLTCRYDIQIENQKDFQVARRIIGSKGCHMKKIIEDCIQKAKKTQFYRNNPRHFQNINQLLKLRLRGRGSGYKEGPSQQESNEELHLCVSAKDQICYQFACEKVEELLAQVYLQYYEYTKQKRKPILLEISKVSLVNLTSNCSEAAAKLERELAQYPDISNAFYTNDYPNNLRITPTKISELLQLRNKARRELNFSQADRIRNFLRNCGVCLIDQKGRRGRATDVTTWKYVF